MRERLEAPEGRVARLAMPVNDRRHIFALRRDIAYVRAQLREDRPSAARRPLPEGPDDL